MVPETERKLEREIVSQAQVMKEKMSILPNMESKVVRDVGVDAWMTSQANDVSDKQNMPASEAENPDINITDGANPGEGDNRDATDDPSGSSTSFQDTFSGADGALILSDDEISSEFHDSSQPPWTYPGYEEAFRMRKKKLTNHWRNFIRPVMWRCKWAELQMKKSQSQALIYRRLLAEYDQGRESQIKNLHAESCSRSLPFPHQIKRKKIMRRRKRKRVEDTTDIASYMLQHNLFAYFENKGASTDNSHLINGYANPVMPAVRNGGINLVNNDDLIQFGDEETSFERILAKIDSMQLHVHNLTTRADKVIRENPGKFSSLIKLAPSDSGASTAQDPTTPSSDKDEVIFTSLSMTTQAESELHVEELIMTDIPVTADQVADSLPKIVESADQPVVANKSNNAEDENPLRKRPISEELIVYRRGMLAAKKLKMLSENQSNISSSATPMKPRIGVPQAQNEKSSLFLASRYTSLRNNQKKRGKRKGACSGKKIVDES